MFEVERPKHRHPRRRGNSDFRDVGAAARAVLAGETAGESQRAGTAARRCPGAEGCEPFRGDGSYLRPQTSSGARR